MNFIHYIVDKAIRCIAAFRLYRKCHEHLDTPYGFLLEEHELLIRAARRCAYDMDHAATDLWSADPNNPQHQWYSDRSHHWLSIFEKGAHGKDYRHDLHREINRLEFAVQEYRKILEENGIKDPRPDVPF